MADKISVAVAVSKGEEKLVLDCIKSVKGFASEIVIFALGTKIKTNKYVKIINRKPVHYIEPLRNDMIDACDGDWVLILDPDERITYHLKVKLLDIVQENKCEVVNIPRKNIFFGKWIAHTNWWPDRQYRFFKKGKVKWRKAIHSYPETLGKVCDIEANQKLSLVHYGYRNMGEFIERQIRYSSVEAKSMHDRGLGFSFINLFYFTVRNFLVRYLRHFGFLDGFYGFSLSFLTSVFIFASWVKLWYLNQD